MLDSMKLEHAVQTEAPIDVVWGLTEDVERWPETTPTMTSVERLDDGPLGVGSQARIKQPGQRARTWTVTRFERGRTFAWSTKALGAHMKAIATENEGFKQAAESRG